MLKDWSEYAAIVIGTGPSLNDQRHDILRLQKNGKAKLFGINNTFNDFPLDAWIACDLAWHEIYSPIAGDFDKWHWDKSICERHGYEHITGKWGDGISTDKRFIHFNHGSAPQAINLAVHYGCRPILLAGHDMHYNGKTRHYFGNLSCEEGEYPENLRKFSPFSGRPGGEGGIMACYEKMVGQWEICNCTKGSALTCFEFIDIATL